MNQLKHHATSILVGLLLCQLMSGCAVLRAPTEPPLDDYPIEVQECLVAGNRIVIDRISVNGCMPPASAWNRTIATFQGYISGEVILNDIISITVPTDENGYWTEGFHQDLDEVGPHQITIIFMTKSEKINRGVCRTQYDDERQPVQHTIIFNKDKIDRSAFLFASKKRVWEIVLLHEIGHALGVPAAPSHSWSDRHCTNPSCVMYPRPDIRSVSAFFFHGFPDDFCKECAAELLTSKNQTKLFQPAGNRPAS